jgi:hypothetical protein
MDPVTDPTAPTRVQSRLAPPTAQFLAQMGRDSFKGSAPALNDVLGKMLTVSTAVLGAGLAGAIGFKTEAVPFWGVLVALVLVLGSLVATLAGLYPREWSARLNVPADVLDAETAVIGHKARCLRWAFRLLVSAFVTAIGCVAWARL